MGQEKEKKTPETVTREVRALPVTFEIREAKEGEAEKRTLSGSIKYDSDSAEMRDWYGDAFIETISPGAFDDSLKVRGVVGLWSHRTDIVLGNTKSGTLRLDNKAKELRFELDIPETTAGNDAWELIKRGDVDGVSFGMKVTKDKWSSEKRDTGRVYKRTILNAELYEISPVAFPAYPDNDVAVRSLEEYKSQEKRAATEYVKRKLSLELDLL
jgi:uncharacterized protein